MTIVSNVYMNVKSNNYHTAHLMKALGYIYKRGVFFEYDIKNYLK